MIKKRFAILTALLMALCLMSVNAMAITQDEAISQISAKATEDGYRFLLVGENGVSTEIRNDLATNDEIYLESAPTGSVKVQVLDADTGKPIEGAQCFLSFSSSRFTSSSDGSSEQKSNPFLLFSLGQTPESGEIVFTDTYFYATDQVEQGSSYYADFLGVYFADIIDEDPNITINYDVQSWFATDEPELFQQIVNKLNGVTTLKFSEYKTLLKEVVGDRYSEFVLNLFDDEFSVFSESVMVEVRDEPQYEKLIDEGKQKLTIGELRTYIDQNRELFDQYVASRSYRDFGGFTPSYTFYYNPEYEFVRTYKDGTTAIDTSTPYLGAWIFYHETYDNTSATGYALCVDGFNYRAYVYADGYTEGMAIGTSIQQDLVDQDITIKIYLSKDISPLVTYDKANAVFGTLTDSDKKPIVGATIKIDGINYSATTNENGYFSFTGVKLDEKTVSVTIISAENGEELSGTAIVNGKKCSLDKIPMNLTGENGIYRLNLVQGTGASKGGLVWIIVIAVVLIAGAGAFVVMRGKAKKRVIPLDIPTPTPNPDFAPITSPELIRKPSFCSYCGAALNSGSAFCASCGARVDPPPRQ